MWIKNFKECYIMLELTDFCNYNCIMCCHDRKEGPHSFRQGFMKKELFEKIVSELPDTEHPVGLKLFWLGEPFLNPMFPEMLERCVSILRKKNNYYIDLHTNAFFMQKDISDLLIKNGDIIPRITLSLDAVNNDTYKKIRRGGDLKKVVSNIEYFIEQREKKELKSPGLIFQFIVMEANKEETGEFVNFWEKRLKSIKRKKFSMIDKISSLSGYRLGKKIGNRLGLEHPNDVIWMKRLDTSPDKSEYAEKIYIESMEKNNLRSEIRENVEIIVSSYNLWDKEQEDQVKEEHKRRPCSGLWKTPCIRWDGELTVCCFDPSMELSLGNLSQNTFSDLWFGEKADNMRRYHILSQFDRVLTHDGYKKCENCSGLDTPYLRDEELSNYIKEKNIEKD